MNSYTAGALHLSLGRRQADTDAKARIAHLVCEMATRLGVAHRKTDIVFDFPVTQSQLADATGQTAVHVNRTLQSLRSEQLLGWHGRVVTIPDWDALADVGEFDAAYLQTHVVPEERLRIVKAG